MTTWKMKSGRISFRGLVRGYDDLLDLRVIREPREKLRQGNVIHVHVAHRVINAVEHMVKSVILVHPLESGHVARRLDHTDGGRVSFGIRADGTRVAVSKVLAAAAPLGEAPCFDYRAGQAVGLLLRHGQNGKSQPLSRLSSDAGQ